MNGTRAIPREPSKSCVVDLAAGAGWCAARARSWFSSQISTKFASRSCCTRLAAQLKIAWWLTRRMLVVLSGASRTTWPRRVSNCRPVRGGHLYLSIPACGVACSTCLSAPKACPKGRRLGHFSNVVLGPVREKAAEPRVGVMAPRPEPNRMAEFGPVGFDHHCHRTVAKRLPGEASIVIFCSSCDPTRRHSGHLPSFMVWTKPSNVLPSSTRRAPLPATACALFTLPGLALTKFLNHEPVPRRPWGNCAWLKPVQPFCVNAQRNTKDSESQRHALIKNYN